VPEFRFGSRPDLERLRDLRAHHPEAVAQTAAARHRRPLLAAGGRLLLIAAGLVHRSRGAP
jgi:hypothetical protein